MAHIKKLNFLKNHKDLVDENYGMVAVPTFSDKMDKDLAELFKSQNKTGKVGDLVFEIDNNSRIVYYGLGDSYDKSEIKVREDFITAQNNEKDEIQQISVQGLIN